MIALPNGWAQWDYQIGTFRAQVGESLIGAFTGDIDSVDSLATALTGLGVELTEQDRADLVAERLLTEGHGGAD